MNNSNREYTRSPIRDYPNLNRVPENVLDYILYPMLQTHTAGAEEKRAYNQLIHDIEYRPIQHVLDEIQSITSAVILSNECAIDDFGEPPIEIVVGNQELLPHVHFIVIKILPDDLPIVYDILSQISVDVPPFNPTQQLYNFNISQEYSPLVDGVITVNALPEERF